MPKKKSRLPVRPVIVLQAYPGRVKKGDMMHLSCRMYRPGTLTPQQVSRIYMEITSLRDGHTVWELGIVRRDAAGFEMGIGTGEMQEGYKYMIRVSNNWSLSPSATAYFELAPKQGLPAPLLVLPFALSALYMRKYEDPSIQTLADLIDEMRSRDMTDDEIQRAIEEIMREMGYGDDIGVPIDEPDKERAPVAKKWVTQVDGRVCKYCVEAASSGVESDGVWPYDDNDAPQIPMHPNCRCSYELIYRPDVAQRMERGMRDAAMVAGAAALAVEVARTAVRVATDYMDGRRR